MLKKVRHSLIFYAAWDCLTTLPASLYSCGQNPELYDFVWSVIADFLSVVVCHCMPEGAAMKNIFFSVLLIVCIQGSAAFAADSADAPALCTKVLLDDDFVPGGAALDILLKKACSESPEKCKPDNANRQSFLSLNSELLKESSNISQAALEAFFKDNQQPNTFEFYELGYIFDTLLLKRVSDALCVNATTRLEKVQSITSWTFEHISLSSPHQKRIAESQPAYPLDIIERGFGLDFQISWAFAALVQQQGLATALAYLPSDKDAGAFPVLVLVFLEEGSVLVDPARGLVWQDPATQKPIGIKEALEHPQKIAQLHPQYIPSMGAAMQKAAFRIPYHPLALLPKMKTVQSVLAETCAARPVLYVDLARAHSAFGHLFCRVEGQQSFSYNPALMTFTLPDRDYSCKVWLLPLVQLFAMGFQDVPAYREARRMHLRAEYDQADLNYRRALAATEEPELRADLTYFLGLLEYDRQNYQKSAFALQRYLDRYYKARADHVCFLQARIYQIEGDKKKSADFMKQLKDKIRYEYFLNR